jgi:hypothetical protein
MINFFTYILCKDIYLVGGSGVQCTVNISHVIKMYLKCHIISAKYNWR